MRSFRPSPALVLAGLALLIALGGTAYGAVRATGSAVNIVDKTTAANVAKVSSGGSLMVAGGVTATPASPSNLLRGFGFASSGSGCNAVLTPPTGKAMVVTSVELDVYQDPSPGVGQYIALYTGNCANLVGDVNPPSVGATTIPLGAGLAVPAGSMLSIASGGSVSAEVYAYGYSVSSSSVPPTAGPSTEVPPQMR